MWDSKGCETDTRRRLWKTDGKSGWSRAGLVRIEVLVKELLCPSILRRLWVGSRHRAPVKR